MTLASVQAEYEGPETYAQDKLVNAKAQLEKLKEQKKAIEELIRAVRKDLRAAQIRARAEKLQARADVQREDASGLVEQAGVAIDLPNLMTAKGVKAGIIDGAPKNEDLGLLFKDANNSEESVFFPAGNNKNRKVPGNSQLPSYIK